MTTPSVSLGLTDWIQSTVNQLPADEKETGVPPRPRSKPLSLSTLSQPSLPPASQPSSLPTQSTATPHRPTLTIRVPSLSTRSLPQVLRPLPPALRPPVPRPTTSTTRRASSASVATTVRRPLKYGQRSRTGNRLSRYLPYSAATLSGRPMASSSLSSAIPVELVPQPSDDEDDPLNWPPWKKELAFWTLLLATATAGVSKTALVGDGANAVSTTVSTTVAAQTGVPLLLSAVSGAVALGAARIAGRRPTYLVAAAVQLFGVAWSAGIQVAARPAHGQLLAARVFQGLAWGVWDALVPRSLQDVYFEHERPLRLLAYDVVRVGGTWGGPLLVGVSVDRGGAAVPWQVLSAFSSLVLLLIVLALPETAFDRSFYGTSAPLSAISTAWSDKQLPPRPRMTLSRETIADYLFTLRPRSFRRTSTRAAAAGAPPPPPVVALWRQPLRAAMAPTAVLLAVAGALPWGALWGGVVGVGGLVGGGTSASTTGSVLTGPWLMASVVVVAGSVVRVWSGLCERVCRRVGRGVGRGVSRLPGASKLGFSAFFVSGASVLDSSKTPLVALVAGAVMSAVGLLALGLYCAARPAPSPVAIAVTLGLMAAGAQLLDTAVRPLVGQSTQFTSANVAVAQRNTADLVAVVELWRAVAGGAFAVGLPAVFDASSRLRAAAVAVAVLQVTMAGAVLSVWWWQGDAVRRVDGRVMRCVDLARLKQGSLFEE